MNTTSKIEDAKKNFELILEMYSQTENAVSIVQGKLTKLKNTCKEFSKPNEKMKMLVFCLDSLQFQCNVLDIEFDDMRRLSFCLNNRLYCDYYKLHKLVTNYVENENIKQGNLKKIKIPVYKDLEPYKQYKIEIIKETHEMIISQLVNIENHIASKENEFQKYKQKQELGFNMQNFVSTFNDSILSVKQKHDLFVSYIHFFHSMHLKYLKQLLTKICLFENQISKDIKFDAFENIGVNEEQQVKADVCENILATPIEEKTNVKTIIKRNVKKLFGGMHFFRRDEQEDNDDILRTASSTSEMEGVAKSIQSEIHHLENNIQESLTKMKTQDAINIVKPIVNSIVEDVFREVQDVVTKEESVITEPDVELVVEEPVIASETISESVCETISESVSESVSETISESVCEEHLTQLPEEAGVRGTQFPDSKPKRKYKRKNNKAL